MKVIEHLQRAKAPLISFEIIPPRRGGELRALLALVDDLVKYRPPFIDITSHPAEVVYEETPQGLQRRMVRKRPGTLGLCALIQNKYGVDAVPHVLCHSFTREETEDFLIELRYLGIDNVLALRGDDHTPRKAVSEGRTTNTFAIDLIRQIRDMNEGRYLGSGESADPSSFCIGAAAYPEKHLDAPNLETCLRRTIEKVQAGAEYLVTQMFFDNRHYFRFVDSCREAGIEVPIIPGIKILTSKAHLKSLPRTFQCEIPRALCEEVEAAKAEHVVDIGVEWARKQSEELLEKGVPSLHYYVMQSSKAISALLQKLPL